MNRKLPLFQYCYKIYAKSLLHISINAFEFKRKP